MKNLLLLVIIVGHTISIKGQDSTRTPIHEYYLSVSNFSPLIIDLQFKKQTAGNRFLKLGLVSLTGRYSESRTNNSANFPVSNSAFTGGFIIGMEYRRNLLERLSFYHGPNISAIYNYHLHRKLDPSLPGDQKEFEIQGLSAGVPYTIGLLMKLAGHFFIAAEINPGLFIRYDQNRQGSAKQMNTSMNFGFETRNAMLSLVYRR